MPSSSAARTMRFATSRPSRWPAVRGKPRAAAQRPFPSMMIPTWAGTVDAVALCGTAFTASHFHDLFVFFLERLADLRDVGVGELLQLVLLLLYRVLGH